MSALRKLRQLKQNAELAAAAPPPAAVAEELAAERAAAKPAGNAFDMLADEEEAEEEEQQQQDEQQAEATVQAPADNSTESEAQPDAEAEAEAEATAPAEAAPAAAVKPKAKKKAKQSDSTLPTPAAGKKKKGASIAAPAKEDWEVEFGSATTASASQAVSASAAAAAAADLASRSLWESLRTEARHLDAAHEIRAVFGSGMERRGGGGGGDGDDDGAAAAAGRGGRNFGGFRRGGAAMVRRVRSVAGGGAGGAGASSSSVRRGGMLVRPSPAWSRLESSGLIKAQYVPSITAPVPPPSIKPAKTQTSGMHGNVHSLASASAAAAATPEASSAAAAAASAAAAAAEAEAARQQAAYSEAVARYQRQQQMLLGTGSGGGNIGGARQYTFVHTADFRYQHEEYLACVALHDVQALARFSASHPFHPEAALSMAEIFASQSEFTTAADLVQRALYVHEQAWSSGGGAGAPAEMAEKIAQGLARIDAALPENAPFFNALAKHAQALGKRGCPRTALEVCKLLLSLSPLVDPQAILCQAIDYYALRAKAYEWMVQFPAALDRAVVSAFPVGQHPWAAAPADATSAAPATSAGSHIATLNSPAAGASASAASSAVPALPAPRAAAVVLPNLMYSRALAAWHLETNAAAGGDKKNSSAASSASARVAAAATPVAAVTLFTGAVQPPMLPSAAAGHSMLDADEAAALADAAAASATGSDSTTSASYLMQQALLMWPSVVAPLLTAAGAESTLSRPAWSAPLATLNALYAPSSGLFSSSSASASASSTPYLAKLELCFAERSGASLWKSDKVHAFILANLTHLAHALSQPSSESLYPPSLLARFASARQRLLLSVPFPAPVRGLQKSSYSDHVAHLPPELLLAQQHAAAGQLELNLRGEHARQHAAQMAANGMRPLDLQQSPLRVFVQSLLPWFAVAGGAGAEAGGDPAQEEAEMAAIEQQLANMPAEQQQALMQALEAQAGQEGAEDDAAGGPIDYQDYEFEDE